MESVIPMRRKRQSLPEETCIEVLERGTSGVLALNDPEQGVPYQVPVNYGYRDGRLTFHGATVGHKVELLKADPRASFTVIDQDQIVPEQYTSWFRSVVCTGRLRLLTDPDERMDELMFMAERFWPDHEEHARAEIAGAFDHTAVLALDIETMSGKEAAELARRRRAGELLGRAPRLPL